MYKIVISISKQAFVISPSKGDISVMTASTEDGDDIVFGVPGQGMDQMMDWLFENTSGRFTMIGTNAFYFENQADAAAFKLVYGG